MADIIIMSILAVLALFILRSQIRNMKKGGGCSGECAGCSGSCRMMRENREDSEDR